MSKPASSTSFVYHLIDLCVTYCGLGKIPKAPGTWGSLGALPLVYFLAAWGVEAYFIMSILLLALGLMATGLYLHLHPENKDPKEVVIDEVLGILVSFFLVPISATTLVMGFLLFRFFDILKPPPISYFDRQIPGAAGVMSDDLVAGFIVNMLFHFVFLPQGWTNWLG